MPELGSNPNSHSPEYLMVLGLYGLPAEMPRLRGSEVDTFARVIEMFSRQHQGRTQMISPGRVRAIHVITARYRELQAPARGELTTEDVLYAWQTNMPENNGDRHPDELFDNAQMNFGHDGPLEGVEQSIHHAAEYRAALLIRYGPGLLQTLGAAGLDTEVSVQLVERAAD